MKKREAKTAKVAKKVPSYTVKSRFTDKLDKTIHEIGEDVSHFDKARLADLVSRKLVKKS